MAFNSKSSQWEKFFDKNQILEIIEIILPYFKTKHKDNEGNTSRYISIDDIDFNKEDRIDEIEYTVFLKLRTDHDQWTPSVIIKQFRTEEKFQRELDYYNTLEMKLLNFKNIQPFPMIHISQNQRRIIYEKYEGIEIQDLDLDLDIEDFLMGKLAAVLQGDQSYSIEETQMRFILTFLMDTFPFTDTEKEKLQDLLEPHYIILPNCNGGYSPSTLFHRSVFTFIPKVEIPEIDVRSIEENDAFDIYIHIIQPEETIVDRMADLAARFGKDSFKAFKGSGNVEVIKQRIEIFMLGYNSVSTQIGIPTLQELYPVGVTLDLQMFISFLLLELSAIQRTRNSEHFREDKDKLRYIYFLLLKKPFLLF